MKNYIVKAYMKFGSAWAKISLLLLLAFATLVIAWLFVPTAQPSSVLPAVTPVSPLRSQAVEGDLVPDHWSKDEMTVLCDAPGVAGSPLALKVVEPVTLEMYIDFRIRQTHSTTDTTGMSYPLGAVPDACEGTYKQFTYSWQAHDDMSFSGVVSEEVRLRVVPHPLTATIIVSDTGEVWDYQTQAFFLMDAAGNVTAANDWIVRRTFEWIEPEKLHVIYLPLILR